MNKNIETFLGCDDAYAESGIVLFGAPFDGTTSYRPGTRMASRTMRAESYGLETYSPYQDKDLEDYAVFDGGDLDLCFGNTARVLDDIEAFTDGVLADGKLPVMIGGEHLVTLGALRAAARKYPGLHIVHFDAHTDLRDDYLGEPLSHASVIRRAWELVGDGRIYQFGIRSGERQEFAWAQTHTHLTKFTFDGLGDAVEALRGKPVYFTIDLDVLDPSVFPGTGTPEAGGVTFMELLGAMLQVAGTLDIVGADVNELSPAYDQSGASTAVACKVLRELVLALCK
ncbi:agmatinase [Intestinibacillus massiliensis]|uniref:agmatinase n=1 Tax=Intestinibacillus massiliensis TaxID=1871029 RepID=UPI000B354009|nr:agmatinase [Intestinibacillus massiliensis]